MKTQMNQEPEPSWKQQSAVAEHVNVSERGAIVCTSFDFLCGCGKRHKAQENGGRAPSKVLLSLKCGRRVMVLMPWAVPA